MGANYRRHPTGVVERDSSLRYQPKWRRRLFETRPRADLRSGWGPVAGRVGTGVRENGGQYTHAALWVVMALARLGSGDEAVELFHMLNPINHSRSAADADRYKTEPYVIAGDVYARPPHAGRGGWSWYTGSAGWMYRAGLDSILGLRRRGSTFALDPCIPSSWPGYQIVWTLLDTRYEITVSNPARRSRGVASATLDGALVNADAIPLAIDGRTHRVQLELGDQSKSRLVS